MVIGNPSNPVSVVSDSPSLPEVVSDSPESSSSGNVGLSRDLSQSVQVSDVVNLSPVSNSVSV